MKTIKIDDDLYEYLQTKAIPYVETPNLTIRRLLLLDYKNKPSESEQTPILESRLSTKDNMERKQPNANLSKLVQAGLLQEGQLLYLYNYRRQPTKYKAKVSGSRLIWGNKQFSMSELAKELLKEEGFTSESVRGPARWYNSDGISVINLWEQYLNSKE